MKNLTEELKNLGELWNASGEFDGTEFEGRFFIDNDEPATMIFKSTEQEINDAGFDIPSPPPNFGELK